MRSKSGMAIFLPLIALFLAVACGQFVWAERLHADAVFGSYCDVWIWDAAVIVGFSCFGASLPSPRSRFGLLPFDGGINHHDRQRFVIAAETESGPYDLVHHHAKYSYACQPHNSHSRRPPTANPPPARKIYFQILAAFALPTVLIYGETLFPCICPPVGDALARPSGASPPGKGAASSAPTKNIFHQKWLHLLFCRASGLPFTRPEAKPRLSERKRPPSKKYISDPAAMTILGKSFARRRVNCRRPRDAQRRAASSLHRHGCGNYHCG